MHCRRDPSHRVRKKGFYPKTTGRTPRVQRYFCSGCQHTFSHQTTSVFRGERKPHVNQRLARLLAGGVSQRRCAVELGISKNTVAKKLVRFGLLARMKNSRTRQKEFQKTAKVVFDEMETFEHTKCKPLSIALAVEESSRKVIAVRVARMPAKGLLARISRKKYGPRVDRRLQALDRLMRTIRKACHHLLELSSDESPRYPTPVRHHFPGLKHSRFKGRRGCVVGQGELKRGGHDPLFSLNHTAAMFRDNVKRLSRRTWCTTKYPARLQDLVDLYAWHHNETIRRGRHRVRI